jgi:hypothetical protein
MSVIPICVFNELKIRWFSFETQNYYLIDQLLHQNCVFSILNSRKMRVLALTT